MERTPGKISGRRNKKPCYERLSNWCHDMSNWMSCLFCRCESHSDRGHAIAALLVAVIPVCISLVISQAPSLLQSHKAEELALILWGGWCIGMVGGVASAYRTHLSWKRGSIVRPTDVVCLELLFAGVMLILFPQFRSSNIVALIAGMLSMSSVVIELGRSRIPHLALSPASVRARTAAYQKGVKPPMGLVAAAGLARHTVLVDISFCFLIVLICLSSSSLYEWAHTSSLDDELMSLPDFSPCFTIAAVLAFIGSAHFGMVRYQEFKAKDAMGNDITSSTATVGGGVDPSKTSTGYNSDADEESEDRGSRRKKSSLRGSLNVVRGKWLAVQAAFCLSCLYGGRLLASSLFGAYYSHLPAYEKSSISTVDYDEEREASVISNVLLWTTTTIGALLASNLVSNWSAGKRSHSNDLALTRVTLVALIGTVAPPLFMLVTNNRVVAWIALGVYGGFNGFASVLALALYTRRLPTVQATRISIIKSCANVGSGLVPLLAAIFWVSAFEPSSQSTFRGTFQMTLAFTGLLPLMSLAFLFKKQSQMPLIDPILAQTKFPDSDFNSTRSSDSEEEMDLESYFMDYRLKQMQEKLTAASKDIEANLEDEDDEGAVDEEDEDDVFGETSSLIST